MAWARVAMLHAAGEHGQSLEKTAAIFGYTPSVQKQVSQQSSAQVNTSSYKKTGRTETQQNKESPRPPARFLRVKEFFEHQPENNSRPKYFDDPSMKLSGKVSGSYDFPNAEPLIAPARLLPFLLTNLGSDKENNRLDHKQITQQLSQGKAIRRLPYLHAPRWPKQLQIIVDTSRHLEPYWHDFECIVAALKRQLGAQAVTSITLDEDTLDQAMPSCLTWPINEETVEKNWLPPSTDQPILILSDLGVTHPRSRQRVRWRRFGQRHLRKAKVLTLSPAYCSPACEVGVSYFKPNPLWDMKLPRHAYRQGFFHTKTSQEKLKQILTLLSALPLVDAALLRKLRCKLDLGSSEVEGQVWNHRDTISTGLGICIDPVLAAPYRARYKRLFAGTADAAILWEVVTKHHQGSYQGLKNFESFSRTSLETHNDGLAIDYMQQLAASIEQSDEGSEQRYGLIAQCRSILSFCPDSFDSPELNELAHELLIVAYREEIERQDWQAIPPLANAQLAKLQSVLESDNQQHRSWQLISTGRQAEALLTQEYSDSDYYAVFSMRFKAPTHLPVTVREYPNHLPIEVEKEVKIDLGEGEVTIESGYSTLVIDAISKPDWAIAIGADRDGLWVSFLWGKEALRAYWQVSNGVGEWFFGDQFGLDQYGLYADLPITPKITQRFRWILPGTFQMGSPESEPERYDDEDLHEVTLSAGYWLADTTVTQEQWQAITGENPSEFKGVSSPVENVSWDDSQCFIQKLNKTHKQLTFQLPTEAQWEYACRADTTTPFSFGENVTPEQVNYDGDVPYSEGEKGENRSKTVPVESLASNAWGLYEMHGNVWEWCQDQWQENLGKDPEIDPKYEQDKESAGRVIRGGSWDGSGRGVRSAYRGRSSPDDRYFNLGLRLSLGQPSGSSRGVSRS